MTNNDVKNLFKSFMIQHSITRSELARRLEVARSTVTMMFYKDRDWTLSEMTKVAAALGLEIRMTVTAKPFADLAKNQKPLEPEFAQIISDGFWGMAEKF